MELDGPRCYQAFIAHDRRFDGRVFAGVVTTGIYCRPICPVRPPRPENMRYYSCAAAAEAAGFRPCRRCRPETAPGTPGWVGTSASVARALRLIGDGALDRGREEALAARLGMTARHLRRLFAIHVGATPAAIAHTRRVHFARRLIDETAWPMREVSRAAGFTSVRQFNGAVRRTFHRTPTEMRRRARGAPATGGDLVLKLPYRPPLDWTALIRFLGTRATPGVEAVDNMSYRRTIVYNGQPSRIEIRLVPDQSYLLLRVRGVPNDGLMDVVERARRIGDLDADPHTIGEHLQRSRSLRVRVQSQPGLRIPGAWDGFELAVRAVLGQQVTVKGATTLAGRLVQTFGTPIAGDANEHLTHLFPSPATLAEADLTAIGLPRARAATISALAAAVAAGQIDFNAGAELDDIVTRLCAVPGIGAWTAHYIAMRALGEPDAFPADDLWLRRALGNGSGPLSARDAIARAEEWRPWRAYAALHLWSSAASPDATRSAR